MFYKMFILKIPIEVTRAEYMGPDCQVLPWPTEISNS